MIDLGLHGKRAFVLGAGRGIGRGTSLWLAQAGAQVACVDRDADRAERTAADAKDAGVSSCAIVADGRRRDHQVSPEGPASSARAQKDSDPIRGIGRRTDTQERHP